MQILNFVVLTAVFFSSCSVSSISLGQVAAKNSCVDKANRPKSDSELAKMTAHQLFDEVVKVSEYHEDFESYEALANYMTLVEKYFRKSGTAAMAPLTEALNDYSPEKAKADGCIEGRLSSAMRLSNDMDRFEFRLRASKAGLLVSEAMEKAIEKLRIADDRRLNKLANDYRTMFLESIKGVNEVDHAIGDTFWIAHKIEMSDKELLEFSNYLISLDPTYPAWSQSNLIKDYSRTTEGGYPLQVSVMKNPERYYDAYLEFKKSKQP